MLISMTEGDTYYKIKKNFKLMNEGYRDGIKRKETTYGWHCTFGIARCGILHTIQVDDEIPILPPAVGWVVAATLVVMFPKDSCL